VDLTGLLIRKSNLPDGQFAAERLLSIMEAIMPKQLIHSERAPAPGGAYSQGLRVGNFIFTAGQGPWDSATRQVVGETIEEQTIQTLENIGAILEAAGASMSDVVKTTVHLSDMNLFSRFNQVYTRYFPEPKPVRTTVGSQLLGLQVEIDVVAYIEEK
jgi:2-iminobutanoate/2-iminopropanoate deaminase